MTRCYETQYCYTFLQKESGFCSFRILQRINKKIDGKSSIVLIILYLGTGVEMDFVLSA